METLHCPVQGCDYASFANKFCPRHGTKLVEGPTRPATNTKCLACKAGGIFPADKFCGTCGIRTIISLPVSKALCLTTQASDCLESEGIDTLWKLISKTPSELLRINGFARVFLTEVVSELDRLGLKLKEEQ